MYACPRAPCVKHHGVEDPAVVRRSAQSREDAPDAVGQIQKSRFALSSAQICHSEQHQELKKHRKLHLHSAENTTRLPVTALTQRHFKLFDCSEREKQSCKKQLSYLHQGFSDHSLKLFPANRTETNPTINSSTCWVDSGGCFRKHHTFTVSDLNWWTLLLWSSCSIDTQQPERVSTKVRYEMWGIMMSSVRRCCCCVGEPCWDKVNLLLRENKESKNRISGGMLLPVNTKLNLKLQTTYLHNCLRQGTERKRNEASGYRIWSGVCLHSWMIYI